MSDKLREQAEKNCILEIVSGSHLYGTSTPTSDQDYVGIFMPPKEYVLGLKSVEEIDLGKHDKDQSGRNTKDAVDRKLYEFRKFINLALGNNPNILEILFANKFEKITPIGQSLVDIRHLFPSKLCINKFTGYAYSQKHKMIIKRDHFFALKNGLEILESIQDDFMPMDMVHNKYPEVFTTNNHHISVGDLFIERGVYVKKARKIVSERLSKITNRSELMLEKGYDYKFGSHLIRLMYEGLDILRNGELVFPLPQREEILSIKNGEWKINEVLDKAEAIESELMSASLSSKLPATPNFKKVEEFCIDTLGLWISNN